MNAAIAIGEHFNKVLANRRAQDRQDRAQADAEWVQTRTEQIAGQLVRDLSPMAIDPLRYALESPVLDETVLDTLHAMLWEPASARTADMVRTLKAQVQDCAASDIGPLAYAREHAEREMQA